METRIEFTTTPDDAGPLLLMNIVTNEGGSSPDRQVADVSVGVNEVLQIAEALRPYSSELAEELHGMVEAVKTETIAHRGRLLDLAEEAKDRIAHWA